MTDIICRSCGGAKLKVRMVRSEDGERPELRDCETCHGTGRVPG